MTLRDRAIEREARLPDGRAALVRVGLLPDPYVARGDIDTVSVELTVDGRHEAFVDTVLEPEQEDAASELADQLAVGLETGELAPTASSIEQLADQPR